MTRPGVLLLNPRMSRPGKARLPLSLLHLAAVLEGKRPWRIIDAKRKEKNLPPVAASGKAGLDPLKSEGFDIRQPQHIALAANLGLGLFDFKSPKGRRHSIDHRIVDVG